MRYEVEKRSKLSKSEFERVKNYLDENTTFLGKKEMISYLFQQPTFLRIRLIKGNNKVLITEKVGEYTEVGRPEKEYEIALSKLPSFARMKKKQGYNRCSCVSTTRYSYKLNELKVELNEIEHLGLIVEIEAMTENKADIQSLENKITKTMKKLQLEELRPTEYQRMMTKMYAKTLKPLSDQIFTS